MQEARDRYFVTIRHREQSPAIDPLAGMPADPRTAGHLYKRRFPRIQLASRHINKFSDCLRFVPDFFRRVASRISDCRWGDINCFGMSAAPRVMDEIAVSIIEVIQDGVVVRSVVTLSVLTAGEEA